ncbi:MAG: hypothetical protein PUB52_01925, partial [Lachnospiraceae bacterium]|nr:hypothetical protein [Lachnospiraceae bacterium]
QNHPNRFLRLLSSAYADSFTGSTSVVPACSGPLLKKALTAHQITYKTFSLSKRLKETEDSNFGRNVICGNVQNVVENLKEQIKVITVGKRLKQY